MAKFQFNSARVCSLVLVSLCSIQTFADGNKKPNPTCHELLVGINATMKVPYPVRVSVLPNSAHMTARQFVASYLDNVRANPLTQKQIENASTWLDVEPANERKLMFLASRAPLLMELIHRGDITMNQLRQAPLLFAEAYDGNSYQPYGWLMVFSDRILVFDLEDVGKVENILKSSSGFLVSRANLLRLDNQLIMNFLGRAAVLEPAEVKDPELLSQVGSNSPEFEWADFVRSYEAELKELLIKTDFRLDDLTNGLITRAEVLETKSELFLIYDGRSDQIFYVTKNPQALGENKKYGIIGDHHVGAGFAVGGRYTLKFSNGTQLVLENGKPVAENAAPAVMRSLERIIQQSPAQIRHLVGVFARELHELGTLKILSPELRELNSLMLVRHPITGNRFFIVSTTQGFVALGKDLPKGWAFLRDLDPSRPARWQGPNGKSVIIRKGIGFLDTVVEEIL